MIQGPAQFKNALHSLLRTQGECAEKLLGSLDAERKALAAGDAEQLDTITAGKTSLLHQLDDLGRQQAELLRSLSFDPQSDGMQNALAWCDPNGEIRRMQQRVLAQLEHCRQVNERNGVAVQQRLGYVRRALDVLHGAPPGSSDVYGPDGRTNSPSSSRLLASG